MTAEAVVLDLLAQMHLLLREHGWEPERHQRHLAPLWWWRLDGCPSRIVTAQLVDLFAPLCAENRPSGKRQRRFRTLAALEKRLQQISEERK